MPLLPGAGPPDPLAACRFPAGETQPASIRREKPPTHPKKTPPKCFAALSKNFCFLTPLVVNCYATAAHRPSSFPVQEGPQVWGLGQSVRAACSRRRLGFPLERCATKYREPFRLSPGGTCRTKDQPRAVCLRPGVKFSFLP